MLPESNAVVWGTLNLAIASYPYYYNVVPEIKVESEVCRSLALMKLEL